MPTRHPYTDSAINVGFTGTRKGMTIVQLTLLRRSLDALTARPDRITVHHGACRGADEQFHSLALERGYMIHIHPCEPALVPVNTQMPHWTYDPRDLRNSLTDQQRIQIERVYAPQAPMVRNRHIISQSDIIFAAPDFNGNRARSGTWATIRHAKKAHKMLRIIYPQAAQNDSYGVE